MLVLFVLFRAVGRAIGGVTRFVYYSFTVPFYLVLAAFVAFRAGWKELLHGQWQEVISILLRISLSGFGMIIVNLLRLAGKGYIGFGWVVLFIVLLVILRSVGLEMGSVLVYHLIFSVLSPLFSLAVLMVVLRSGMSGQEAFATFIALVALLFMIEGLYLVLSGAASSLTRRGS